jgi:rhamnosyltransferase
MKKVAVIVVTYNPQMHELDSNIKSYIDQVDKVYIIDNSTAPDTRELMLDYACLKPKIELTQLVGNFGIAHAQNIGFRMAKTDGYAFAIEMDQDSSLPPNYTSSLLQSYDELKSKGIKVAGIGPVAVNEADGLTYGGRLKGAGVVEVAHTLSSGFLVPIENIDLVGLKNEQLFIDFVDWEWCWRSASKGLGTYVDTRISIKHQLGIGHKRIFFWYIGNPSPIRHYYQYRNFLYLLNKPHVSVKWKFKYMLIMLSKIFLYALVYDSKNLRFSYIIRGFRDFFSGKMGKINKCH